MTSKFPQAIFFDFDGVLVDSNQIKVTAFYELFRDFDTDVADKLVHYHKQHGGISRVVKIQYAFEKILGIHLPQEKLNTMAKAYSELVIEKVIHANWIPGAEQTLQNIQEKLPVFVISGTPQDELRLVITRRKIGHYFNEILGSPIMKPEHIANLCKQYTLQPEQCVFVGDAFTDYDAARRFDMPFIGIQGDFTFAEGVTVLPDCKGLLQAICDLGKCKG